MKSRCAPKAGLLRKAISTAFSRVRERMRERLSPEEGRRRRGSGCASSFVNSPDEGALTSISCLGTSIDLRLSLLSIAGAGPVNVSMASTWLLRRSNFSQVAQLCRLHPEEQRWFELLRERRCHKSTRARIGNGRGPDHSERISTRALDDDF